MIEPDHLARRAQIELDLRAKMAVQRERRHRGGAPGALHRDILSASRVERSGRVRGAGAFVHIRAARRLQASVVRSADQPQPGASAVSRRVSESGSLLARRCATALALRELNEVAACIVEYRESDRSRFRRRLAKHDTQRFHSFVLFLNVLDSE